MALRCKFRTAFISISCGTLFIFMLAWGHDDCMSMVWGKFGSEEGDIQYLTAGGLYLNLFFKALTAWLLRQFFIILGNVFYDEDKQGLYFHGSLLMHQSCLTFLYFNMLQKNTDDPIPILFPAVADSKTRHNGLKGDVVQTSFPGIPWMRIIRLLSVIARAALVVAGAVLNAEALPRRDPREPLNEARYYIVFFEATVLIVRVIQLSVSLGLLCCRPRAGEHGATIAGRLERVAEWSALSWLRGISVATLGKVADAEMETARAFQSTTVGLYKAAVHSAETFLFGLIGMVALAVKLAQLDFVAHTLYWEYSRSQVIRLVSFGISVVGIYDIADIEKWTIQRFLVQDYEFALAGGRTPGAIWTAWNQALSLELRKHYGFMKSFLIMATLDASDIRKLLIKQDWQRVPDLYARTIMQDDEFSPAQLLAAGTNSSIVAEHRRDLAALRERGFLLDFANIGEAAAEESMPLISNSSRSSSISSSSSP